MLIQSYKRLDEFKFTNGGLLPPQSPPEYALEGGLLATEQVEFSCQVSAPAPHLK